MKRVLVFTTGLMLMASTAFAQGQGLHMAWAGCPNHPAATETEDFTCDGGSVHSLQHQRQDRR